MINITVKNAAGTDVVYVAAIGSAGDKSPARWSQNALVANVALRPVFECASQSNGPGTVRRVTFSLVYPVSYTDTNTGQKMLLAPMKFEGTAQLPKVLSTSDWNEGGVQFGNLVVSAVMRAAFESGYAPT